MNPEHKYDLSHLKKVYDREFIQKHIAELAAKLNKKYHNQVVTLICIISGGYMFFSDLSKLLTFKCRIDFICYSSYKDNLKQTEAILSKDLKFNPEGENVLLIDDLIESGDTMHKCVEYVKKRKAKSVQIAVMMFNEKTIKHNYLKDITYSMFPPANGFMVGYGLDDKEFYRNVDEIYVYKS